MAVPRLLAIDVDGTLLRRDGALADADRAAIAAARGRGLVVTLATGRLSAGTLPLARELGLDAPLVCADGAVLFCPVACAPLAIASVPPRSSLTLFEFLRGRSLAPFLFTHEAVLGAAAHSALSACLRAWSPMILTCDDLDSACHAGGMDAPVMAVGVGTADAVRSAETALRAHPEVGTHIESFAIGGTDQWLVRLRPPACNKAIGLASLAERMGLAPSQVATIGDWHNDLEMLKWSGWSFAVGHAPDEVKRAAKHPLESTALSGGAVAEAIAYLEGAQ